MGQRYVWWDELERVKKRRIDLRIPEPMFEFLKERSEIHGVSMNALVTGILAHAVEAGSRSGLRIEVVPSVRVTAARPSSDPVTVTAPEPSPAEAKRWNRAKAR